ncbi:vancomycin resistance protein, partial [Candidatus Peregrinibacteria bacterium]|nr:vancomycin resistance protein [Candidatus Peregrinibacteria bacterium]
YLPELVIKPEGTIPEYGGGLCQVSSTIYRAALMSGLPIVERSPHSYAVSYYAQIYGYGLDATIYIGVHDVKFINDTPGHILIQAYAEGSQAFFKFYGTDDGRSVALEGPYQGGYHGPGAPVIVEDPSLPPGTRRQVEYGHTGFNATWYRHMVKDGEEITETIYSAYRAIPAKIVVGPSADAVTEEE